MMNVTRGLPLFVAFLCIAAAGVQAGPMPADVIVMPTPRKIAPIGQARWVPARRVDVFVVKGSDAAVAVAAEDLVRDLGKLTGDPSAARIIDRLESAKANVVVVLGIQYGLPGHQAPAAPAKPEGYSIHATELAGKWYLHLNGCDRPGALWATKTLKQLARLKDGRLEFLPCHVEDWPWYRLRSTSIDHNDEDTVWAALDFKINAPYHEWIHVSTKWRDPPAWYRKFIPSQSRKLARRGLNLLHRIHPYWVAKNNPPYRESLHLSRPGEIDKLLGAFRFSLDAGNRLVNLMYDDASRLVPPEDLKRYGSVAKVHAETFRRFQRKLKAEYPHAQLIFMPEPYSGAPKEYFDEFTDMADDVITHWVGPSGNAVSLVYKDKDLRAYRRANGGRRFIIHDNVPYQRYGLQRGICLFDPFADGYGNLYKHCYGHQASYAFRRKQPVLLAHGMVIADYMWNADRYNAEKTVARVMAKMGGRAAVPHLQAFRRNYIALIGRYPVEKVRRGKGMTDKALRRYVTAPKQFRKDQRTLEAAERALGLVAKTCTNKPLTAALADKYRDLAKLMDMLAKLDLPLPTYQPHGNVKLSLDGFAGGTGYKKYGYKCQPRFAVWAYGLGTADHEITTAFQLSTLPSSPAHIVMDCQADKRETLMEVLVNGKRIHHGPCGFAVRSWGVRKLAVPQGLLRAGRNTLTFRNATNSVARAADWIMFSGVALEFGSK